MTSPEPANSNQAVELRPWVIAIQAAQAGDLSHLAVWRMAKATSHSPHLSSETSQECGPTLRSRSFSPRNNPMPSEISEGSSKELDALALFTEQVAAERYAEQYCANTATSFQVMQFSSIELLSVLAECYREGMRYAALNPSGTATQQLFILRDVLSAAQTQLRRTGNL